MNQLKEDKGTTRCYLTTSDMYLYLSVILKCIKVSYLCDKRLVKGNNVKAMKKISVPK